MSPISSYLQAGAGWQWLGTGCILHPDQAMSPCHQERATASSPTRPKGSLRLPPPGLLWCWISPSRSPPSHPFVSPRSGSGSISALEIVAAPCPGLFPACTKHHALSLAALGCFLPKIHPPPPGPAGPSWPCLGARGHRGPHCVPRHLWDSGVVVGCGGRAKWWGHPSRHQPAQEQGKIYPGQPQTCGQTPSPASPCGGEGLLGARLRGNANIPVRAATRPGWLAP